MPEKISEHPDTIAGYDIVVGVSEESVNAQLQKLYDTPIVSASLPPPRRLAKFQALPASKHLINHRMSLHMLNSLKSSPGKLRFRPTLEAKISDDPAAMYKKPHVEITFERNENAPVGTEKDSVLVYLDSEEDPPTYKNMVINGYTIAWTVKIARRDVQDVMNDIILASRSSDDPAQAAPRAQSQLEKYVDSQVFTVSSIFCLFEEQTMVESFRLLDAERNVVMENPNYSREGQISHRGQDPGLLQAEQFNMSVTPGDGTAQQFITTSGTLNFCMLTQRPGLDGDKKVEVDETDFNAGVIKRNFFDITKSMGKTTDTRGYIQGHDGIMAFSKELFHNMWLRDLLKDLKFDPVKVYRPVLAKASFGDPTPEDQVCVRVRVDSEEKRLNGWCSKKVWKMDAVDVNGIGWDPYSRRQFALGDCSIEVKFSSDKVATVREGITQARRLYIDIDIRNTVTYVYQTKGANSIMESPSKTANWWNDERKRGYNANELFSPGASSINAWLNARTVQSEMRSLIRVVVHPGSVGQFDVSVDENASKNLLHPGKGVTWTNFDGQEYGNFSKFETHHTFTDFGKKDLNARFEHSLTGWGDTTASTVQERLRGLFNGPGTTIIMPAGDVFSYAGLEVDDQGNLYAQINYANEGKVQVNKK
ncbi:uncharacterized protein N7483_007610 [Penicillium malachiteum]|uniref:uncharacterized protein n=1 Tax=Penicillium malachiteum TaxID=1324776 RepID=UPI002549744E|nr:uncharacterized protein N7483_007610 [Penicillium malachiteum]KAJ5726253.1 hypothetical protein N7483_007610 [Penicillium malachiteum]